MNLLLFRQLEDGIGLPQGVWNRITLLLGVQHLAVVPLKVAHSQQRHKLVAALHLGHAPTQTVGCVFHIGDDGRQQMRDTVINRQFQHFGVD